MESPYMALGRLDVLSILQPPRLSVRGGDTTHYLGLAVDQLRVPGIHGLVLLAQSFDAQCHAVARAQVDRVRLLAQAHARRRAGADHVTRIERHEAADVTHQLR